METRETVSARQKEEWIGFRREILNPLYDRCASGKPYDCKDAKTVADIIKICQEGERKAWDFNKENTGAFDPAQIAFEEE